MLGRLFFGFGGQGLVVHRPLTSPRAEEFNGVCVAVLRFFSGAPWARPDEPATPDRGEYLVR